MKTSLFPLVLALLLTLFISFIHDIYFKVNEVGKKSCSEHWKGKGGKVQINSPKISHILSTALSSFILAYRKTSLVYFFNIN